VRSTARPAVVVNWPGWVRVWGLEPGWQRGDALSYLDNHFTMIGSFAIILGLNYLVQGLWNALGVLCMGLIGTLSVTAIWLYLVIRWIDREAGWAEQHAVRGASSGKTA